MKEEWGRGFPFKEGRRCCGQNENDPKEIGDGPLGNRGQPWAVGFGCVGVHTPLFPWRKQES